MIYIQAKSCRLQLVLTYFWSNKTVIGCTTQGLCYRYYNNMKDKKKVKITNPSPLRAVGHSHESSEPQWLYDRSRTIAASDMDYSDNLLLAICRALAYGSYLVRTLSLRKQCIATIEASFPEIMSQKAEEYRILPPHSQVWGGVQKLRFLIKVNSPPCSPKQLNST